MAILLIAGNHIYPIFSRKVVLSLFLIKSIITRLGISTTIPESFAMMKARHGKIKKP
jgi:hypothetical protein